VPAVSARARPAAAQPASPAAPYELKAAVARGIAGFWPFPHSQIYSEAARLAEAGLLTEEAESAGRRRRTYAITQDGQQALAAWLAEPSRERPQIRSLGMLQLYFGEFARPEDRAALAAAQIEVHREMLGRYQEIRDHQGMGADARRAGRLAGPGPGPAGLGGRDRVPAAEGAVEPGQVAESGAVGDRADGPAGVAGVAEPAVGQG